jgi:dihydrofolate reductase
MAKMILSMNVSLDGYVDDVAGALVMPAPSAEVFRFWIETVRAQSATIYGRRMYEVMRYWDQDDPNWSDALREFAEVWRKVPKFVVSSTLDSVGPNAALITGDIAAQVRDLKARTGGTISVSGPRIAGLMTELGLIDEYGMVLRPYVLGQGKPFFHGARPPLRLVSSERLDADTMHLVYVPAS